MGNKSMKGKISAAVLLICMAGLLAGCQGSAKAAKESKAAGTAETAETAGTVNTVEMVRVDDHAGMTSEESSESELESAEDGSGAGAASSTTAGDDYGKGVSDGNASAINQAKEGQAQEEQVHENAHKEPPAGWELALASEDWGLGFGEAGAQPTGNASADDLAWYDAYYVGDDSGKVIYLTFDCGYENGNTEPILDALMKHNAQATFFVVGHFLETAPDLVKRMAEEGHTVGNHTYHHLDMSAISDRDAFQKEMDDVAELFHEITGTELSPYYRPPQGKCNVDNLKLAQELGYNTIFWSLAYVDWNQDDQPSHAEAFDKLTTRIHPGAIVLLHNTSQTNGEILDELLVRWEGMGYSFKPLADLTGV